MDDWHWNLIQYCWSSVEERPAAEVIIPIIQQFLKHCPQSRPLRDLLISRASHPDSLMDKSSLSLSQDAMEGSSKTVEILDEDNRNSYAEHRHRITVLSDLQAEPSFDASAFLIFHS
ncbi:hypothetical protein J3R83DRAFT_2358 [Lanmaoa asiatica]|nr:hypothetical protein J3R83DRAFT_2358 [Lanmaoa asiatica]